MPLRPLNQLTTVSFDELNKEYDQAINWLGELGAPVGKGRLGTYGSVISELAAGYLDPEANNLSGRDTEISNALYEAHEVCEIFNGLAGQCEQFVRDRADVVGAGPISYTSENVHSSSNKARNFAFELLVASRLVRGGFPVKSLPTGDISTELHGVPTVVECKRPQTIAKYPTRVKEASDQLKRRYRSTDGSKCRGLIAVDVTKILNPSLGWLSSETLPTGIEKLIDAMWMLVDNYVPSMRAVALGRTLGIMLRASALAVTADRRHLSYCSQYILTPFHRSGSRNHELAFKLGVALGASEFPDMR